MILEAIALSFSFFGLVDNSRLSLQIIYNVLDLFFLKYGLYEISLLMLIIEAPKFFSLIFMVTIFSNYYIREK